MNCSRMPRRLLRGIGLHVAARPGRAVISVIPEGDAGSK